jgi:nickel/cobalt transporter (NicO) family protein
VLSTLLLGWILAFAGDWVGQQQTAFLHWVSPLILCLLGAYYIYAHYYHHHFHLHERGSGYGLIASLALAMFLSPCLEIEGFFLAAGGYGFSFVLLLSAVYSLVTITGMLLWVWLVLHGLHQKNWHSWEHYAGIITGLTLLFSGLAQFYSH